MKLAVLYKYINCTVDGTTGTGTGYTIYTYINYVTKYITSILLTIFWYYWLDLIANLWKVPSGEICTYTIWTKPFLPNPHPHNWFMPLKIQKICWKISKWCYYKSNHLEIANSRIVAQWVKTLQMNWKLPGSNPVSCLARFRDPTSLRGLWRPLGQNLRKCSD